MSSADGRLDLDALGQVIDSADSLDPPEVLEGAAGRTLGERLESVGVTPWLRRHRVLLASVAAFGVALGAVAWVRHDTRPPDDGLAHVAVVDALVDGQIGPLNLDTSGVISATYTLVKERTDDTVAIVGFTGPGVRAAAARPRDAPHVDAERSDFGVTAILGCQDPAALTASDDDFRLLVERTDAFGRTVRTSQPLPSGSMAGWGVTVASLCLQNLTVDDLVLTSVTAVPDAGRAQVTLSLGVRNLVGADLLARAEGWAGMGVRPGLSETILASGATTTVTLLERVQDCQTPHLEAVTLPGFDGQASAEDRGVWLYLATGSGTGGSARVPLVWSPSDGQRVASAFAQACAGMPTHRATSASSGPAPEPVRLAALARSGGDVTTTVVRTVVEVVTSADRVDVADLGLPEDVENGWTRVITSASAPVVGGRARLVVDWTTSCAAVWSPPGARLTLRSGGRSWPAYLLLDDPVVARGLVAACPYLSLDQLYDNGWSSLARTR